MAKKQNANRNRQDDTSLKKGESQHSKNGYQYRWTDRDGKRHTVYASSLEALRIREKEIDQDLEDNIKREAKNVTINEMYELWRQVKRGIKDNTSDCQRSHFARMQSGFKHRRKDEKKSSIHLWMANFLRFSAANLSLTHAVTADSPRYGV